MLAGINIIYEIGLDKFDKPQFSTRGIIEVAGYLKRALTEKNTDNKYTDMIADISTALTPISNIQTMLYTDRAKRSGLTMNVNDTVSTFVETVRNKIVLVKYTFGINSPQQKEIFPQGMKPYNHLSRENVFIFLDHLVLMGTKYKVELGNDFSTTFTAIRTTFEGFRNDQLDKMVSIADSVAQKAISRKTLTMIMTGILLAIGREYLGNSRMIKVFFKMSILCKHQKKYKNFVKHTGLVESLTTLMITTDFDETKRFRIFNLSKKPLLFGLSINDISSVDSGIAVAPENIVDASYQELGNAGSIYLKVTNNDPEIDCEYKVEIY